MHSLALTLHKTVSELADTMTMAEYVGWNLFFEERNREREAAQAEHERERKRAENKARGIIDFSDPDASAMLIAKVRAGGG